MAIDDVLYTRLSGYAPLVSLISTRVYPGVTPQNVTVPYVTYTRISAVRESGFGTDIGVVQSRFQFDIFADSYSESRAIAAQVRAAVQRWSNSGTSPAVYETLLENDFDGYDATTRLHHAVIDALIFFAE
jgi:hypothetical protein